MNRLARMLDNQQLGLLSLSVLLTGIGLLIPCEGIWVVDCGLRFLQLVNIVERHSFGGFWLDYPLQQLDPAFDLVPFGLIQTFVHTGRLFAQYPPWFCYATAPFYALFGQCGPRVLPLITGIWLLWGIARLASLCKLRRSYLIAGTVLFGTPLLPYVYIFWDIIPALAFAVWGQMLLLEAVERASLPRALAAGALLWLAFVMREEYLLWAACCLVAATLVRVPLRLILGTATAFGIGALLTMAINRALIGVPLFFQASTGSGKSWEYSWSLGSRGWVAYRYLAFVQGAPMADAGLLLALGCLAFVPRITAVKQKILFLFLGSVAAFIARFYAWDMKHPIVTQYLVSSMAASAPLVFLGFSQWELPHGEQQATANRPLRFTVICSILFLFLTLALSVPSSAVGLNFGPRLLLPIYPGFVLGAFAVIQGLAQETQGSGARVLKALVAILIGIGFADSVVHLDRLTLQYRQIARMEKFLSQTYPGKPVLAEQSWFATMFPRLFYSRPILPAWDGTKVAKSYDMAKQLSPEGFLYVAKRPLRSQSARLAEKVQEIKVPATIRSCDSAFEFYLYYVRP